LTTDHLGHLNKRHGLLVGAVAKAKALLTLVHRDIFMAMSLGAKHHNLFQGLKRSNGFSGPRIQNSMTRIFH